MAHLSTEEAVLLAELEELGRDSELDTELSGVTWHAFENDCQRKSVALGLPSLELWLETRARPAAQAERLRSLAGERHDV